MKKDPTKVQTEEVIEDVDSYIGVNQLMDRTDDEDDQLNFTKRVDGTVELSNPSDRPDSLFEAVEFDKKEFSHTFLFALVLLFILVIKLDPSFIRAQETESFFMNSPVGAFMIEAIAQLVGAFRILTPLWLVLLYQKVPPLKSTLYRFKVCFWGMETVLKPDYPSQISRVRVSWIDIVTVEFRQTNNFDYLELLNNKNQILGIMHLGVARKKDIIAALSKNISKEHPLVQKLKTMIEIKG